MVIWGVPVMVTFWFASATLSFAPVALLLKSNLTPELVPLKVRVCDRLSVALPWG